MDSKANRSPLSSNDKPCNSFTSHLSAADSSEEKRRLQWAFRKVDATLLFILFLNNVLNSMDRSSLGLAKVAGLEKDTGMSGSDFNVVTSTMYPTYLLFVLPSNLVLRKVGARIWLSLITVVWGIICMCMAFAKNRTDLILCRLFLGAAESGAPSGALMLIALWYPREMVTSRVALFYSGFAAGAAIGGPVASAITKMDNPRFKSWEWIFFIEGLIIAGFGLLMFLFLSDYPDNSWMLKHEEKALIRKRMEADQIDGGHRAVNKKKLLVHARDPLIYTLALIAYCGSFPVNTIVAFTATIVNQMGYSPAASQAMQAVPALGGFIGVLVSRYYPKWFGSHYFSTLFCAFWTILASIILLSTTNNGARIFALCVLAYGGFGLISIAPGWLLSNTGGPTRSAFSSAVNVEFRSLGSLCASYIYRNQDEPQYIFGHAMNLGACLLSVIAATIGIAIIRRRNRQKDAAPIDISHLTRDEQADLENDHPSFGYVE